MNQMLKQWSSAQFPTKISEKGKCNFFPFSLTDISGNFRGSKTSEVNAYPMEFVKVTLSSLLNVILGHFSKGRFCTLKTLEVVPYAMEFIKKGKREGNSPSKEGVFSLFHPSHGKCSLKGGNPFPVAYAGRGEHFPMMTLRITSTFRNIKNQKFKH